MPFRIFLKDKIALVGTPDYCLAGYYRSPIVVRCDDQRQIIEDFKDETFAFNQTHF